MKVHLKRVHGLALFLPEQSKEDWVYAQLGTLAKEYAEAESARDKKGKQRLLDSLLSLHSYHRGMFPIEHIYKTKGMRKENLKRVLRSPSKRFCSQSAR
jgi:hypothetical protein